MPDWAQWFALLLPLAATVLAVTQETLKEQKPGSRARMNRFGIAALSLAVVGFGTSAYTTWRASREASENAARAAAIQQREDAFMANSMAALNQELPGAIRRAVGESQAQLDRSVADAITNSQTALDAGIRRTTGDVTSQVTAALATARDGIVDTIDRASRASEARLASTVQTAVDSSGDRIRVATDAIVERQTRRIGELAEHAVATQIMQIPLNVEQHSARRLGGPLADLQLLVGDVSVKHAFQIALRHDSRDTVARWTLTPAKGRKGEVHRREFTHPINNQSYALEMVIQSQQNPFGSGIDYLVARVVPGPREGQSAVAPTR
jgi:hypothetical protein